MKQSVTEFEFGFDIGKRVICRFDVPELSSDGGALLLRGVDDAESVCADLSSLMPDAREASRVDHSRFEQIRQRVFGIALGWADQNDADALRLDPIHRLVCSDADDDSTLSSQPTLSRFENAASMKSVVAMQRSLEDSYVAGLPADTSLVVLDVDGTADAVHGNQQLSFFHGYYNQRMYFPLLMFDADGALVSLLLRPGNKHDSRGATPMISRVIVKLKKRFPGVQIVVRGDSHFAVPRLMRKLEELNAVFGDVDYLIGIAQNSRLKSLGNPVMMVAKAKHLSTECSERHYGCFEYAAGSWKRLRVVVARAEYSAKGSNPRFVLTSLSGFPSRWLYKAYCQRGQCENWIKDFKNALFADRLSCTSFVANFFRLVLHAAAYRLMTALRNRIATFDERLGKSQLDTIRLKLLKVAVIVKRSFRRILCNMPKAFPLANIFRSVALSYARPP